DQNGGVQPDLSARRKRARGDAGVVIAGKKRRLKEHQTCIPDRGRTAERGQQHPGDHRLNEKEKGRAEKERERIQRPCGVAGCRPAHAIRETSSVRVSTPTLSKTWVKCFLIVAGDVPSVTAISRLR